MKTPESTPNNDQGPVDEPINSPATEGAAKEQKKTKARKTQPVKKVDTGMMFAAIRAIDQKEGHSVKRKTAASSPAQEQKTAEPSKKEPVVERKEEKEEQSQEDYYYEPEAPKDEPEQSSTLVVTNFPKMKMPSRVRKIELPSEKKTLEQSSTEEDYQEFKNNFTKDHAKDGLAGMLTEIEKSVPGFESLTPGARMLTVQAYNDRLLAEVSKKAKKGFSEQASDLGVFGKVKEGTTMLGKLKHKAAVVAGRGINGVKYGLRKNYLTKGHQEEAMKSLTGADLADFVERNQGIAKTMAETGLDVRLYSDGRTALIDYARESSMEPGAEKESADAYNRAATALTRIPAAWSMDDATPAEKQQYAEALKNFEERESDMLSTFKARDGGDAARAAIDTGKIRLQVEAMRFFSQHPEATDMLRSIKTDGEAMKVAKAITQFWKDKTSGANLKYMLGGMGIRTGTGALAGYAAAGSALAGAAVLGIPVAAATAASLGALRGRDRAKAGFREDRRAATLGEESRLATQAVMSRVDVKFHQLSTLTEKLVTLTAEGVKKADIAELRNQLLTNVEFIKEKKDRGEINYASAKNPEGANYALLMAIHAAEVTLQATDDRFQLDDLYQRGLLLDSDPLNNQDSKWVDYGSSDLRRRTLLGSLQAGTEERVKKARAVEIRKQMLQGAIVGGAFGSLGAAVMQWYHGGEAGTVPGHEQAVAVRKGGSPEMDSLLKHAKEEAQARLEAKTSAPAIQAHVEFSSKGAEQTILNFRHSPGFKSLTPDQQAAFEGSVAKIAKELKEYRPDAADGKESVSFEKGSQFNVSPDGKIFVTDPSGKVTPLGHIEGSHIKGDVKESDLTYIHAGGARHAAEAAKTTRVNPNSLLRPKVSVPQAAPTLNPLQGSSTLAPETDTLSGLEALRGGATVVEEAPVVTPVADSVSPAGPESLRGGATIAKDTINAAPAQDTLQAPAGLESLRGGATLNVVDTSRAFIQEKLKGYSPGVEFTPSLMAQLEFISDHMVTQEADKYFSYYKPQFPHTLVEGHKSLPWQSFSTRQAGDVLRMDLRLVRPQYRSFIQELHAYAEKYPTIRRNQTVSHFLKQVYARDVEERAMKGEFSK